MKENDCLKCCFFVCVSVHILVKKYFRQEEVRSVFQKLLSWSHGVENEVLHFLHRQLQV